jgi:hypothetical protein
MDGTCVVVLVDVMYQNWVAILYREREKSRFFGENVVFIFVV